MDLIRLADRKTANRGWFYAICGKVSSWEKGKDGLITGTVKGTMPDPYQVTIDIGHPEQSVCTCPYAEGSTRVCKHMVALFFTAFPERCKNFSPQDEDSALEEEEEDDDFELEDDFFALEDEEDDDSEPEDEEDDDSEPEDEEAEETDRDEQGGDGEDEEDERKDYIELPPSYDRALRIAMMQLTGKMTLLQLKVALYRIIWEIPDEIRSCFPYGIAKVPPADDPVEWAINCVDSLDRAHAKIALHFLVFYRSPKAFRRFVLDWMEELLAD